MLINWTLSGNQNSGTNGNHHNIDTHTQTHSPGLFYSKHTAVHCRYVGSSHINRHVTFYLPQCVTGLSVIFKSFLLVWKIPQQASLHLTSNRKTALPFGPSGTGATSQGSDGTSQPHDSIYFMYSSWFSCSVEDLKSVFISLRHLDVCLSSINKFTIYIISLRLSDWHLWVVHLICSKLQFWLSASFLRSLVSFL